MTYCMCRLVDWNSNDKLLRNPSPKLCTGLQVLPYNWSKYKVRRYVFTVVDIPKLKKHLVWVGCGEGARGNNYGNS